MNSISAERMIGIDRRGVLRAIVIGGVSSLLGVRAAAAFPARQEWTGHVHNDQPFAAATLGEDGYRPPVGLAGLRHDDAEGELALRFLAYHF